MSRNQIERITCDRCGEMAEFAEAARERGDWTAAYAASLCGQRELIGTSECPADLCPSCSWELIEWISGRKLQPEAQEAAGVS